MLRNIASTLVFIGSCASSLAFSSAASAWPDQRVINDRDDCQWEVVDRSETTGQCRVDVYEQCWSGGPDPNYYGYEVTTTLTLLNSCTSETKQTSYSNVHCGC